jgi:hypothetical protein
MLVAQNLLSIYLVSTAQTHGTSNMHLISEDEARRVYFSPESRPTASQWRKMRRRYSLPALFLEKGVFYWTDELEESLAQINDVSCVA